MTYDTTTTDGVLVRDGLRNGSSEANETELTISPETITQKHDHGDSSHTVAGQQSTDYHESESTTVPSSSSQPSGSTSSSNSDDMKDTRTQNSLHQNNNTISLRDVDHHIIETSSSNESQTSTESACDDYHPNKGDVIKADEKLAVCYNPVLDDEIRNRLDKLNALSDLINSLERKFDQANMLFRETLKCSTEKLSTIAKTLGSKSIRHGRVYHDARIALEQIQSDCQWACVQFEQANHDHQYAKDAIRDAETKLKQMNIDTEVKSRMHPIENTQKSSFEFNDLGKLSLDDDYHDESKQTCLGYSMISCDNKVLDRPANTVAIDDRVDIMSGTDSGASCSSKKCQSYNQHVAQNGSCSSHHALNEHDETKMINAAKLSEDLNQAINRLFDAEQKRRQSEKLHLDQANKLMIAQENLLKLEREHGTSIKRSQVYFDEAKRFNIRLNLVKSDIARISEEIIAAKQAYAKTLNELEQFSEDLHFNSNHLSNLEDRPRSPQQSS